MSLRPLTGISASLTGHSRGTRLQHDVGLRPLTGISASLTVLYDAQGRLVTYRLRPLTGISASLTRRELKCSISTLTVSVPLRGLVLL